MRATKSRRCERIAEPGVGFSGGTIASGVEVFDAVSRDADVRRQFVDPYTLSPDRGAEPELGAQPDLRRRRGHEPRSRPRGRARSALAMKRNTAVRRLGTAREAADAVVFLASSASSYTTGQSLAVDGGYSV